MTAEMSASRVVARDAAQTFELVLPMPLNLLFVHWYGPIPPIRSTEGPVPWQAVGQRRRVNLVGPGWMTETLTEVEPPDHFSYRLENIHGPMSGLVAAVDGRWSFTPAPADSEDHTLVTWTWRVTPRTLTRGLLPAFARLWTGYADRVLLTLDELLGEHDPTSGAEK